MIVKNSSSYPTTRIRELLRFSTDLLGFDTKGVEVHVKPCRGQAFKCRAYNGIPFMSKTSKNAEMLVVIKIGKNSLFPITFKKSARSPRYVIFDWREALVAEGAHEFTHIHQFRNGLKRSEVDAEYNAKHAIRRYRSAK